MQVKFFKFHVLNVLKTAQFVFYWNFELLLVVGSRILDAAQPTIVSCCKLLKISTSSDFSCELSYVTAIRIDLLDLRKLELLLVFFWFL